MALSKLGPKAKAMINPLFEVTPVEWDNYEGKKPRTMQEHLDGFCKKFKKRWARDNGFIDVSLLNRNGVDDTGVIEYIYNDLHLSNHWPAPVVQLGSTENLFSALDRTFELIGLDAIGLRVGLGSLMSEDILEKIDKVLSRLELTPQSVHLIIDLRDANYSEVENFKDGIIDILDEFPYLSEWRSFTIAGTAFPKSGDIKSGLSKFNRNDWTLYKLLKQDLAERGTKRVVNFGDYSIVNPDYFEFNPLTMSPSAKIRYTHNDKWIVAKGKSIKSAGFKQYISLAAMIYDSGFYLGEGFSEGSLYLARCIRGEEKTGNTTTWVWVDTNHHFTKVLFDLFAILPGS